MKSIRWTVAALFLSINTSFFGQATGELGRRARDLSAEARASVNQAVFAASATMAAAERASDVHLLAQRREILSLQERLTKAGGQNAQLMAELASSQERYVQELAARDLEYAQNIAAFRDQLQDIASTPEGEAALQQFNAGDQQGALNTLDRLRALRRQARRLEDAADARHAATLALESHRTGKLDTKAVIDRYKEIVGLDPGVYDDWKTLGGLYLDSGQLADAESAAESAVTTARDDSERAIALNGLGDVLEAQGDLPKAQAKFEQSLKIDRQLAAKDSTSQGLQREISVTLNKIGGILYGQGDVTDARKRYEESVKVARNLADAQPISGLAARDLSVSLLRLGDVLHAQGDLAGAYKQYQDGLDAREALVKAYPDSVELQNDVAAALERTGDVRYDGGDLAGALDRYQKSLEIRKRLVLVDPGSEIYQSNVAVSLDRVGGILLEQGDFHSALPYFTEGLEVSKRLAAANLDAMEQQREVSVALNHLGDVQVKDGNLAGARTSYEESLRIVRQLASAHPDSTDLQRDISVSANRVGDVQQSQGDTAGARMSYEESLRVRKRLVEAHPTSVRLIHDLLNSYAKLSMLTGDKSYAQQGLDLALAKQSSGVLADNDRELIDGLRELANR